METRARKWLLIFVFVCATVCAQSRAQSSFWRPIGPCGGRVVSLAVDPSHSSTVYAGTAGGGIFKSTDGGEHWFRVGDGLPGGDVKDIVIDAHNPSTVYAAVGAVYKSTDGGLTWRKIDHGLTPRRGADCLAIDPRNPRVLYAGVHPGVFKSTDGGDNWFLMNNGFPEDFVMSIAINPKVTSTIYAGTLHSTNGLYKSTDGGKHWHKIRDGQTTFIAVDRVHPETVYISSQYGIFKSPDGGASWQPIPLVAEYRYVRIVIDPVNPSTLYVSTNGQGIYKSSDGGTSFQFVNSGLSELFVKALAVDPTNSSVLYAGAVNTAFLRMSYGRVYKSTDGGQNWTESSSNMTNTEVVSLAVDPANADHLYVGLTGAVFETDDGGQSWRRISGIPVHPRYGTILPWDIVIDPANPSTLYVSSEGRGVFKSTDGGGSWFAVNDGLPEDEWGPVRLTLDPTVPTTLYASFYTGVYRSTDGGDNWWAIDRGLPESGGFSRVAIHPSNPDTLYVGVGDNYLISPGDGVFKSTDQGASWFRADSGLSEYNRAVCTIAIDPGNPRQVYLGLFGGGFEQPYGGIYKSTDAGDSWYQIGGEFSRSSTTSAVVIDPTDPSTLWVGNDQNGVFRSSDGGASWEEFNAGLATTDVSAIIIGSSNPALLYAGTRTSGVYRADLTLAVDSGDSDFHDGFAPSPNYPNPFNTSTLICYDLPSPARVELAVYNLRGQRVRTLVEGWRPAGSHQVRWNGTDDSDRLVPSGVYAVRLRAAGELWVRKVVLVR